MTRIRAEFKVSLVTTGQIARPARDAGFRKTLLRAFLVILFVEIAGFGVFAPRMGFYSDDWTNLERLELRSSFSKRAAYYLSIAPSRPGLSLLYPGLHSVAGKSPGRYQAIFLTLEVLAGLLLFLFLTRLFCRSDLALLAVVLAMLYPCRIVTHFWLSSSAWLVSLCLLLAGLLLHQAWLESRRAPVLAGGLLLYLFSILTYEAPAFLPLLLWGGLVGRRLASGEKLRPALLRPSLDMAPYAAVFLLAAGWQRFGLPLVMDSPSLREMSFSPGYFLHIYRQGAASVSKQTAELALEALSSAPTETGLWMGLLCAAASVVLGLLLLPSGPRSEDGSRPAAWTAAACSAAGFFGAYLPYTVSTYVPSAFGINSRTSAGGGLAAGILLAAIVWACLTETRTRRWAAPALRGALMLGVSIMLLTNWSQSRQWADSWTAQNEILSRFAPHAAGLPKGSRVLLAGTPYYVGGDELNAGIFTSSWGLTSAIHLTSGRDDLAGDILPREARFLSDGLHGAVPGESGRKLVHPYKDLYLYHFGKDKLTRLDGPPGG